jgi:hypothetical protein
MVLIGSVANLNRQSACLLFVAGYFDVLGLFLDVI